MAPMVSGCHAPTAEAQGDEGPVTPWAVFNSGCSRNNPRWEAVPPPLGSSPLSTKTYFLCPTSPLKSRSMGSILSPICRPSSPPNPLIHSRHPSPRRPTRLTSAPRPRPPIRMMFVPATTGRCPIADRQGQARGLGRQKPLTPARRRPRTFVALTDDLYGMPRCRWCSPSS
jgi:hypothetical protein